MSDHAVHMRKKPASDAVQHWRWQRASAVVILFLSCWLMTELVTRLQTADAAGIAHWLANIKVAVAMEVLILAAFIHKHIGIHEILLDYVHKPCTKKFFNLLLDLVSAVLALGSIAAIWHLHLVGLSS